MDQATAEDMARLANQVLLGRTIAAAVLQRELDGPYSVILLGEFTRGEFAEVTAAGCGGWDALGAALERTKSWTGTACIQEEGEMIHQVARRIVERRIASRSIDTVVSLGHYLTERLLDLGYSPEKIGTVVQSLVHGIGVL